MTEEHESMTDWEYFINGIFDSMVRCGRTTSSRSGDAPRTAVPSAQKDLPWAYGCGRGYEKFFTLFSKAGSHVVKSAAIQGLGCCAV